MRERARDAVADPQEEEEAQEETDDEEVEPDSDQNDQSAEEALHMNASDEEGSQIDLESPPPSADADPYTMPDRYPTAAHPHPSMAQRGTDAKENWRVYLALLPPNATQDTVREMGFKPPLWTRRRLGRDTTYAANWNHCRSY